jgi:hypothetical protein
VSRLLGGSEIGSSGVSVGSFDVERFSVVFDLIMMLC